MKHLLALALIAGIGTAGAGQAQAQPQAAPGLPQMGAPASVLLVAGGCGPRGYRDRFGRCRPTRYAPPRYRGCPPGFHRTPYGCRRNF